MTSGWIRLFGVFGCVVAVGAFVFVFNAEATVAFLYWIEYLYIISTTVDVIMTDGHILKAFV